MTIQIGGVKNLAGGRRFYAYSGIFQGGVTNPPDLTLIDIKSTGLKDSFVKIEFFYGVPTSQSDSLGGQVFIDDVEVFNQQPNRAEYGNRANNSFELFVPRQSKLTVKSLNTAANTLQERGVNILGWYL